MRFFAVEDRRRPSVGAGEIEELDSRNAVGPLQGFRSKMGRPFAAVIKLSPEFKPEFDFGQHAATMRTRKPVDFTGQEPLGTCPKLRRQRV